MKKIIMFISALICSALIISCGHGNNSSSGGISFKLPNGSTLSVPAAGTNLSVAGGESTNTIITLSGGSAGMDVVFSSSVTPSAGNKPQLLVDTLESQVVVKFNPVLLTSGGTSYSTISITVDPATTPGKYLINLKATYEYNHRPTVAKGIGTITVVVSGTPGPTPVVGAVDFVPESQTIQVGNSFDTILTLSGSSNVESFTVNLAASTADATVSPASCELSSANASCRVTVTGVSNGVVNITATPNVTGYTVTPFVATVTGGPILGTIAFHPESQTIESGGSYTATLTLTGSSGISSVTVLLTSANPAIASISLSSCVLESPYYTCSVTITGESAGVVNITAEAGGGYSYTIDPFVATITPPVSKVIFVTATGYTGDLGGFAGADDKCNADSNKPSGGATYKALLAGRSDVLVNGVTYYAKTGEVIGIAEVSDYGWFASSDSNYIDNSSNDSLYVWTGGAGTATSTASCNGWTSANSSITALYGYGNSVTLASSGMDIAVTGLTGVGGLQGNLASWLSACPDGGSNCNFAASAFVLIDNKSSSTTVFSEGPCNFPINLYCAAQ